MNGPLNFGNSRNPFRADGRDEDFGDGNLKGFDSANGDDDLSGFDEAPGTLVLPAGYYILKVESGALGRTQTGKPKYAMTFRVVCPLDKSGAPDHSSALVGFKVNHEEYLFKTERFNGFNKAKAFLNPFRFFKTKDDLGKLFPPPGCEIFIKALVTVRPPQGKYAEKNSIERFELCDPPADAVAPRNPFAVPLDDREKGVNG